MQSHFKVGNTFVELVKQNLNTRNKSEALHAPTFIHANNKKEIVMLNYHEDRIRLLDKLATLPNPIEFLDKFDRVCPQLYTEPVIEVNIFDEVQAVGISLNHTLKDRIMRCNVQQVRLAIEEYKRASQQEVIDNPGGMFYRILEKKSNGFGFF